MERVRRAGGAPLPVGSGDGPGRNHGHQDRTCPPVMPPDARHVPNCEGVVHYQTAVQFNSGHGVKTDVNKPTSTPKVKVPLLFSIVLQ